jgi:hypothetical protein
VLQQYLPALMMLEVALMILTVLCLNTLLLKVSLDPTIFHELMLVACAGHPD